MSFQEESALSNSETLCNIGQKQILFSENPSFSSLTRESQTDENIRSDESSTQNAILSLLWRKNKLGAAYYKINDKQLYFMQDMVDTEPEHRITRTLIRSGNPLHIITIGNINDNYIKRLIDVINKQDQISVNSDQARTLPENVTLLHFKNYMFEACMLKIFDISLACESENITKREKELLLRSLIDFESKLSVHAFGMLIKFLEKNWPFFCSEDSKPLHFLDVNQISFSDSVFIDHNTFNGLQIFKIKAHDANFKHGHGSSNKEGFGLFKLFSQHCRSKIGQLHMRHMMLNPIKNINELNKRLDFIKFVMVPENQGLVDNLQDEIAHMSDLNQILLKIQYARATSRNWECLHKTIYRILHMNELCGPYRESSPVLEELNSVITMELYKLQEMLNNTLDFSESRKKGRPVIQFGLDSELDAKKLKYKDIAKNLITSAKFTINQLPDFIHECSIVYIPEMGYLVSIKEWEPNCDRNALQEGGCQFIFEVRGNLFYKNAMCKELDRHLGDIQQEILAHETRIIERLSAYVLQHNKSIRESLKIAATIDCLISMSKVAKERNYICPTLNTNDIHEIENGRHPIHELHLSNFVPNNYKSGGENSQIKVITGPNASGKSIYLKQIAILIYLAHIGSYLPADKANIAMVDSIYSRISTNETASIPLSAFMVDATQIAQALHSGRKSSVILIDEFGRGTLDEDGIILLTGAIKHFIAEKENCPHVIISTHYHSLRDGLPKSALIGYYKTDHTLEGKNMVFLYRIVEGSSSSYALDVALANGLSKDIVSRAKEFYDAMINKKPVRPLPHLLPPDYRNLNTDNKKSIEDFLKKVNIPK